MQFVVTNIPENPNKCPFSELYKRFNISTGEWKYGEWCKLSKTVMNEGDDIIECKIGSKGFECPYLVEFKEVKGG